jgi:hypothetical protein
VHDARIFQSRDTAGYGVEHLLSILSVAVSGTGLVGWLVGSSHFCLGSSWSQFGRVRCLLSSLLFSSLLFLRASLACMVRLLIFPISYALVFLHFRDLVYDDFTT